MGLLVPSVPVTVASYTSLQLANFTLQRLSSTSILLSIDIIRSSSLYSSYKLANLALNSYTECIRAAVINFNRSYVQSIKVVSIETDEILLDPPLPPNASEHIGDEFIAHKHRKTLTTASLINFCACHAEGVIIVIFMAEIGTTHASIRVLKII